MSQNSNVIPTSGIVSGLTMAQDINLALDSLQTFNSGAAAPTSPQAYMPWVNTTLGVYCIRNAANTAWIVLGPLSDFGIQSGAQTTAAAAGTADVLTATLNPAPAALTSGMEISIRAANANVTTTPTLNLNGLGAVTIKKGNAVAVAAGDIAGAGHWIILQYDATGACWLLQNPATGIASAGNGNGVVSVAVNTTLTNSAVGKEIYIQGNYQVTLPLLSTVTYDQRIRFKSTANGASVVTQGADITYLGAVSGTSITLNEGDTIEFFASPGVGWISFSGSVLSPFQAGGAPTIPYFSTSVAAGALTATLSSPAKISGSYFGVAWQNILHANLSITIPALASLGAITTQQCRLAVLYSYQNNALAVINMNGGVLLDESNQLTPVVISAGSTAASALYSASGTTISQYKVVGFIDATWTSGTGWATPTLVSTASTASYVMSGLSGLGWGQWVNQTGSRSLGTTYYNTSGRPRLVSVTSTGATSSNDQMNVLVNGAQILTAGNYSNSLYCASFVVPPSASYQVNNGAASTLSTWYEM